MRSGQTTAGTPPTVEQARDWTLQAARAVHGLVDFAAEHPRSNPGPWTISFDHHGRARCRYSTYPPHKPAVMICDPGWYRFIWGPHLNDLASHLWKVVADDLKLIGVDVDVPIEEARRLMYWGPMPVEGAKHGEARWSEPRRTRQAQAARQEYLEALVREHPSAPEPFPVLFKCRRPLQEELDARLESRRARGGGPPRTEPGPESLPLAWDFGHWGKGFMSASGQMYTWRTSLPTEDGHPQHREAQGLIEAREGSSALEEGREITNSDVAHFAPIVIAPGGQYTQDSADPLWQGSHFGEVAEGALHGFDPARFASLHPALRQVEDSDRWAEENMGHGQRYSHAVALAAPA